ncbi:ATP-, maltotriose-and DNA-dependent transcriptional regulator MalT, partial [Mycobacterium rhizamassiliense]
VLETSCSASVLEEIERENLFVVPLDMSRHWYRYHQLFAELLRTELRRSEPDLVADLHRRAANWFESQGLS